MNWKLNKTIRIKKRKENKRKEIITIIMDWAQFLSWAWSKWAGGFFLKKPCEVGWAISKKRKKKRRKRERTGSSTHAGERNRKGHCANQGTCRNFDRTFGRPNDLRFGPNSEEVLYSTRRTSLRWLILFLTVKFSDLRQGTLTLKLKFLCFSLEKKNCKYCHYELIRNYGCCVNFSRIFGVCLEFLEFREIDFD